jgi:hypothetical protein
MEAQASSGCFDSEPRCLRGSALNMTRGDDNRCPRFGTAETFSIENSLHLQLCGKHPQGSSLAVADAPAARNDKG